MVPVNLLFATILQLFAQGGGGVNWDGMDYWGESTFPVQSMQQTRGSVGMLLREILILDLLLDAIWDCLHSKQCSLI